MKLNKILGLGVVLSAVLSVGMVVSASAAEPASYPGAEGKYVQAAEFPLNDSTFKTETAGSFESANHTQLNGILNYSGLGNRSADSVKVSENSSIGFSINKETEFYITLITKSDDKAQNATLYKDSGSEAPDTKVADFEPGTFKTYDTAKLGEGNYYITCDAGTQSGSAVIEEIEFTDDIPKIKILSETRAKGNANNEGKIAIVKDGDAYYAVAVFNDTNLSSYAKFGFESKDGLSKPEGLAGLTQVYEEVKFDGDTTGYDANVFGTDAKYLYAFKLEGAGANIEGETDTGDAVRSKIKFNHE